MNNLKIEKPKVLKIDKSNYDFLKNICSHSNISFHEMHYVNANKYFTCLQIFEFPERSYVGFLNRLIGMDNVLVKIDVSSMDQQEYEAKMEKALKKTEEDMDETNKRVKFKRVSKNNQELSAFDDYIDKSKQTVKTITLRLYLFGKTHDELQNLTDSIINILSRMKMRGFVQTNDLQEEYKALTSMSNPVKKMVASSTLADCMQRSEINYIDPRSVLLGLTKNGLFCANPFLFKHTSYGKVFMSKTGGGKSAIVKRMIEGMELKGNHTQYIFDIHNEYKEFCKRLNIPIVSISENNYVNLMEIFYTENQDGIITKLDVTNKLDSVTETFVSFNKLDRKQDKTVIMQFKRSARHFYQDYIYKNINDLKHESWFTLSDVMRDLKYNIKNNVYRDIEKMDIYVLELCIDTMIEDYGMLFDHKTNIDFDLTHSLCFDFSFLQNNSDKLVKASYMEMFLNYVSYGFYLNNRRNLEEMANREIKVYELSEPLYTCDCVIEEFMECAVSRSFLEKCKSLVVYARKAFCGLSYVIHASQDLQKGLDNNGDLLEELFGLSVHKYIGEIDGSSLDTLMRLIPALNEHDIALISQFKKEADGSRPFMAVINDNVKIPFTSIVSPYQREYYAGGA